MLNFSRTKIITIVSLCVFAFIFALPTFLIGNKFIIDSNISKFLPTNKVNLGLDLKGGSQLLLEIDNETYIQEQINFLKDDIKTSFYDNNIRTIVENINNKILFKISDDAQKEEAKKLIKKLSDKLVIEENDSQFQIYFSDYEIENFHKNLMKQSIEIIRRRIDENGTKEPSIVAQGKDKILLQVPGIENSDELKNIIGKTAKMSFHLTATSESSLDEIMELYDIKGNLFKLNKKVIISGDLLVDADTTYFEGVPAVAFRFNSLGSKKFTQITTDNLGKIFAIVLDGKVITAPVINSVINQGSGVISGDFTVAEANQLSLLLRAGALPAPLKIIEERLVGPSLGSDSINSGKIASMYSVLFIGIFMILFYGIFGIFANIALFVNITIIITFLSLLSATLTLPGIAGIILTMGMSVDANVLIFERIKEELKNNKSIFIATEQGFNQAYRTIIDSNITTLIIAFFLYVFGNGTIKGFAVTLSIGIMSSMFTAILLTRMFISIWLKKYRPKKLFSI
jgi:preprotein translocase subunit SecD